MLQSRKIGLFDMHSAFAYWTCPVIKRATQVPWNSRLVLPRLSWSMSVCVLTKSAWTVAGITSAPPGRALRALVWVDLSATQQLLKFYLLRVYLKTLKYLKLLIFLRHSIPCDHERSLRSRAPLGHPIKVTIPVKAEHLGNQFL